MSADRLSYTPSLCWPALRVARRARPTPKALLAERSELVQEDFGRVVFYTNAHEHVAADQRPLLLLHGMHLHAGAHDFVHLFAAFRAERQVYAADLPGFSGSDHAHDRYDPELYVGTVKQLIELCASEALAPVDVLAVGLTCEYAARAAAALPDMVNTLTLVEPTGFASEGEESVLERLARRGSTLLPLTLLERLRLARFCGGGFAAVLSGAAFPQGNAQTAYTRVHCPTLVLHPRARRARYGTLARFVRWRPHYQASELESTRLADRSAVAHMEAAIARFSTHGAREEAELKLHAG